MKKIIITGATSMLGAALTEKAVRENTEVYAIVRPDTKRRSRFVSSPLVHYVCGTLENLHELSGLPADCDVLYHFAWAGTGKETRDDPRIQENNIRYTLDAVRLAEKTGCRRFVGAGSQAEYGPLYEPVSEETKFAPVLSYGIAKYAAGILSRKLCAEKQIAHIWGRVFSVYGPHDNDGTMLKYAIECWNRGEAAAFSSGEQLWNYLYETDAGEIFYRLGADTVPAGAWTVAGAGSVRLRTYIETMMRVYGAGAKAEFAPPSGEPLPGLDVSAEKTFAAVGFRPQVDFAEGIGRMIRALQSNAPEPPRMPLP